MPGLKKILLICSVILAGLLLNKCGDESLPTESRPQGCQSQGVNAIEVLQSGITCSPTNAFHDATQALGGPDAEQTGSGKLEFHGFVSLGVSGTLNLFMGSCIQDLDGPDLRVFQTVADESVEVQVSQNPDGPFVSLGTKNCIHSCDFDLAGTGLNDVRVVKLVDQSKSDFPGAECDNVGPSPGADIDAVEVLHPGS